MSPKRLSTSIPCYASSISAAVAKTLCGVFIVALFCLTSSLLTYAQTANSHTTNTDQSEAKVNQQQAIAKAKQSVPGKVLKVDRNKEHYRVKMLNQKGRVISVNVNKQSGKVTPKSTDNVASKKNKD